MLDLNTTLVIFGLLMLLAPLYYFFVFLYNKDHCQGLGWILIGSAFFPFVIFGAMAHQITGIAFLEALSGAFYLISPLFFYLGLKGVLLNRNFDNPLIPVVTVLAASISLVLSFYPNAEFLRGVLVLGGAILLTFRIALMLWGSRKKQRAEPIIASAIAYGGIALMDLLRLIEVFLRSDFSPEMRDSEFFIYMTMTQAFLYAGLMLGLLLIVNNKILIQYKELAHKNKLYHHELKHRVKNNLSLVASMINLESLEDPEAEKFLRPAAERVMAISSLYEQLSETEDPENISTREYVEKVLHGISESTGIKGQGIQLVSELDDHPIPVNRAVPLGLILNELVTNAIKHGFTYTIGEKRIEVSVKPKKGKLWEVQVYDTGVIAKPKPGKKPSGLGKVMVKKLVQQLQGKIISKSDSDKHFVAELVLLD